MKLSNKLKTLVAAPVLATSLMIAAPQAVAAPGSACTKAILAPQLMQLVGLLKAVNVACGSLNAEKAEKILVKATNKGISKANKRVPALFEKDKCDPDLELTAESVAETYPMDEVADAGGYGEVIDELVALCDGIETPVPVE